MDINKDQNLRNLDEKLELIVNEFSENIQDITDKVICEKRPANDNELQNTYANISDALTNFQKNIISYLEVKYKKESANGYDLQDVCRSVSYALTDFKKTVISYLRNNE